MKKSYAVFGLGRYGYAVAKELVNNGADVMVVDINENLINSASSEIPVCKCADITNKEALKNLGIASVDVVIIAMANSLESAVLSIMHCKELGVKQVIVKCSNETHKKIFEKVGADKVILPEYESGIRLAKNLLTSGFVDVIDTFNEIALLELEVKPEWCGKTLVELNLRMKYSINIIAIRDNGKLQLTIDPNAPLQEGMQLIVVADASKISKIV